MERIKEALERARASAPKTTGMRVRRHGVMPVGVESKPITVIHTQTRTLKVSTDHLRRHRIISSLSDPIAEAYKIFRTRVIHRMKTSGWRSLGITSPRGGVGKSVTSINLAISLSREVNHTVLLVDLDLRRPKIGNYLFSETEPGVCDFLRGDKPLSDFLISPGMDRLVVLPGSSPVEHSSEMLSSPKMVNLAKEVEERYESRIVIYDLPPILECDDVVAFSPFFDAALMVVEDEKTTKQDLRLAIDMLDKRPLLGTVLNKAKQKASDYPTY